MIPHLLTPAILAALGFGLLAPAALRAQASGLVGSRIHKHEPWSHR